jgi:hypothetical protein
MTMSADDILKKFQEVDARLASLEASCPGGGKPAPIVNLYIDGDEIAKDADGRFVAPEGDK